jgi:PAS domain S-box-containing protein
MNTSRVSDTPLRKLRKSLQPSPLHSVAVPDSDPAKRPPLAELRQSKSALEQRVQDRAAKIARAKEVAAGEVIERHRNVEMLRQSEERFSKAFCSNPLPMTISTETEGRYLDVNDSFLTLMGYERSLVIGHTMAELGIWVNPQDYATMMSGLSDHGTVVGLPTQIRVGTGVMRDATISAEQIELLGQLCVLAVTQDTTETKRLQATTAGIMLPVLRASRSCSASFRKGSELGFSEY